MQPRSAALLAFILILAITGCERSPDAGQANARSAADERGQPLRIVTYAPALTQMVIDLGLGEHLVGVPEHDMAAPPGLPVVGHYADVRTESLLTTEPTHVLTIAPRTGTPQRLRDLADAGLFELVTYPPPLSLEDVAGILAGGEDLAAPGMGEVLGEPERARELASRMQRQLTQIREATAAADPVRTLLVISAQPVMVLGPGTTHDQMLAYAGGHNAVSAITRLTAPTLNYEALTSLQPEAMLLLLPEHPPLEPGQPPLSHFQDLPVPAVQQGRVHLLNDPLVLLPTTSIPQTVAAMAKVLHPDLAERIDRIMAEDADVSSSAKKPGDSSSPGS